MLDVRNIRQRLIVAGPSAYVRRGGAERLRRRPIEASYLAVAPDHDDRNIDRVQDANYVGATESAVAYRLSPLGSTDSELSL